MESARTWRRPRHRSAANGSCISAMLRLIHTTWSPHMIASTGYGWLANDCPSELATCVVGKEYQHRSPPGWLWITPTVPDHPASSHVWGGTTRVAVEWLGPPSARRMGRTP